MHVVDTQENGTCATTFRLVGADLNDMRTKDLKSSFDKAPPLSLENILLSSSQEQELFNLLKFTVLRIVILHGGPGFQKFEQELRTRQPSTADTLETQQTEIFPLPAMNIDESTLIGNAEVIEAILKELGLADRVDVEEFIRLVAGDQLSIARLRTLLGIRAGHEGILKSLFQLVLVPGLFHAKLANCQGFFNVHLGHASQSDPGSAAWHNTVLGRNPIVGSSLPPFRTCRDLMFTSLYARVLHCILQVSGKATLEEYADSVQLFDNIEQHASQVLQEYASGDVVQEMRDARAAGAAGDGDMIFENAALFLRDALLSRAFTDAIKVGDSGHVVLLLKVFAFTYRGCGRTKYAYEMLHLIHNLEHIWPVPVRYDCFPCNSLLKY